MSLDSASLNFPASYTGRYYALPLRGRLTPYEGGSFASAASGGAAAHPSASAKPAESNNEKNGFSFAGFLDIINPLQHIPIISSLYRRLTGDEITPVGRVAGDTLFFGVIGLASALVNTAIEKATGKDAGDHVMTALLGEKNKASDPPQHIAGKDADSGVINALAAAPDPGSLRGRVTVHPKVGVAAQTLDAATLDALARTMGSYEPFAHLLPDESNNIRDNASKKPASLPAPTLSAPEAASRYDEALLRMQQGFERYQARKP
jgi:hypothetical protein